MVIDVRERRGNGLLTLQLYVAKIYIASIGHNGYTGDSFRNSIREW